MAWVCALDLGIHWYLPSSCTILTTAQNLGLNPHIAQPISLALFFISHFPHHHANLTSKLFVFQQLLYFVGVMLLCCTINTGNMIVCIRGIAAPNVFGEKQNYGQIWMFPFSISLYKEVKPAKNVKLQWISRREYGWIYCVGVRSLTFVSVFYLPCFKS